MPRQEMITKEMLLSGAFELLNKDGEREITARRLSAYIGCSTQPIFRNYKGMEDLLKDVYAKALDYYEEYYASFVPRDNTPFVNMGLAYILFAAQNKFLFEFLFMSETRNGKSLYEILNGKNQNIKTEFKKATEAGCHNPEELFMKMWIFIHGAATMSLTDDYDLDENATLQLLRDAYRKFS